MADKNIQLKDMNGNSVFPKTKGALVTNANGQTLEGVQAGAQVNIIETVKVNGSALTPDSNKAVNVVIPAAADYTVVKDDVAATGYAATYHLTKDGTNVGAAINIPKDMVVSSGSVETCTQADVPVEGLEVGDKYIDLVLANASNSHVYIPVTDLIDIYTGGNGINVNNNVISIDTSVVATQSDVSTLTTAIGGKQDTLSASNKLDPTFIDVSASYRFVTDTEKSTWDNKQAAITSSNKLSSDLVDDTNKTHLFVTAADKTNWNGKADAATTLSGYGITDALTYEVIA
jgi:hypothetical protein